MIDCPPALDLLTLNALVAADSVLIPMQAEYFALEGVTELLDTIDRIKAELNPGLAVEGVVITMFDDRTNLAQSVAADLKGFFGDLMCETTIPRNIRLAEAPSHGKPALLYDPKSRGSEAYLQLAQEIMDRAKRDQAVPDAVGTPERGELIGRKVEKIHDGKTKSAGSRVGYAAAVPAAGSPTAGSGVHHGESIHQLAVELIDHNPYQTRSHVDEAALQELAASIKATGVLQPITVRAVPGGRYQLIAGRAPLAGLAAGGEADGSGDRAPGFQRAGDGDDHHRKPAARGPEPDRAGASV